MARKSPAQAPKCLRELAPFERIFHLQTGIHTTELCRFLPEILDAAYLSICIEKSLSIQPASLCGVGSQRDRSEAPEVAVIVLRVHL